MRSRVRKELRALKNQKFLLAWLEWNAGKWHGLSLERGQWADLVGF